MGSRSWISSVPINDPSWESGAYCYAGWMQQELLVFGGGAKSPAHLRERPFHHQAVHGLAGILNLDQSAVRRF